MSAHAPRNAYKFVFFSARALTLTRRHDIMKKNYGESQQTNQWSDNSMSELQQVIVEEPANAGMDTPEEEKPSAGGYRALAVIAFVCAVGGLFIGLLYAISGIFLGNFNGNLSTFDAENVILADSLFGYVYAYFATIVSRGVGTFFSDMFSQGNTANVLEFGLLILLCVTVILSVVLMIVSFCSRKAAKNCAMTSAILVFLTYAGYFLLSYYLISAARGEFTGSMIDLTVGIPAGIMLVALIVTAFARRKGLALVNVLSLLLVAAAIFGLTYPGSAMAGADIWYSHIGDNLFVNLTAFITMIVVILNFIVCAVRLSAKKAYVFDAVRFGILLIAVVLAVIAQIIDITFATMFGSANLLAVILSVAAPLAAFLLALIVAIVQASRARAKEAEEESAQIGTEERQISAAASPATVAAAQPQSAAEVKAEAAAEPAAQQTVAAPGTTVIVQQPAAVQQPATPIYAVPFFATPMSPAPAPQAAPEPAPAPAPAEEKPAPAPAPAEDTPMSEFERSMAALARGIAPEPAPAAQTAAGVTYQYAPAPAPTPAYAPAAHYAPAPAYRPAAAPKAVYDPTPYTYDSFINMLTPQERNEFGDLFIANRYGDLSYLPAYVIGGDNREFFHKVFIYLGKFRSHISPELLGKLYEYVSKL